MYNIALIFHNELKYRRRYVLNSLMFIISMYIFAFGNIFSTKKDVRIVFWFVIILTATRVYEHFYEIVKSDVVTSIINSKTSLVVYCVNFSIVTYTISILIAMPIFLYFYRDIGVELIIYIFTALMLFTSLIAVLLGYLTILFKRTSIMLSIFSMYLLFYSGFVFETDNVLAFLEILSFGHGILYNLTAVAGLWVIGAFFVNNLEKQILLRGIQR